jgi:membrane protease YdiL (CAAX protease family)
MWLVLPAVACFGVFMAFVFNRAGGSVLITMAAHLSLNVFSGIGGIEFSYTSVLGSRCRRDGWNGDSRDIVCVG